MKRVNRLPLLAALALGCAGPAPEMRPAPTPAAQAPAPQTTPDDAFRAAKPPPLDKPLAYEAPVPEQRALKNGLPVLIRQNHALPLVVVEVMVKAGVGDESREQAGIADFVASMLTEGTATRSAMDIARQLEDLAAVLSANAGLEATRVHLNCLKETLPRALDVLADVVQNPAFRPADTERVRGLRLTELEEKKAYPPAVASDQMARLLWGDKHPWGQPSGGTPATVKAMTPKELARFHAAFFHANNAQVSVSGDITPDELMPLLEARFGGWSRRTVTRPKLPALPAASPRLVLVDRPHASQAQVWMGTRLFPATSPNAVPMYIANDVLGGLFTSRLNMNLREEKAYTYGVRSTAALYRSTGALLASGGIFADKTVDAASEMMKELRGLKQFSDAELAAGKAAIIRSIPSVLETNDAVAAAINSLVIKGLPLDYYATLPAKVSQTTREEVDRVAARYVDSAPFDVVVVGPAKASAEGLKGLGLGRLEVVDDRAPRGAPPGAVGTR